MIGYGEVCPLGPFYCRLTRKGFVPVYGNWDRI